MKTLFKSTLLATSMVLALTACSDQNKDKKADNVNVLADRQMKAEELAAAGEQLVSPYTFMLADKVFDMALEKDPENKKAQFYKAFVKRMMVLKGIVKRVAPMAKKDTPKQQKDYENFVKNFPNSPLKNFLMDGPEDIKSYSQFMDVFSDYNQALNDFRKFLKLNASLELTLNLNPHIFESEINEAVANSCVVNEASDNRVDVDCDYAGMAQKKLNSADLIALRQMTGGEMLAWSLYTAYDFSIVEELSKDGKYNTMAPKEQIAYLRSLTKLAPLKAKQTLSLIPELGSDFSAAAKWAIQYQDRICPKGIDKKNQRRGFLFKDGLCVKTSSDSEKTFAMLDQVFGGIFTQPIMNNSNEQVGEIRVNLVGFLKNPPTDLKNILPEEVDEKGNATRWSDNTFGGLLPDGDIHKFPKRE